MPVFLVEWGLRADAVGSIYNLYTSRDYETSLVERATLPFTAHAGVHCIRALQ